MPVAVYITLNARLRPLDRGDVFEDPLVDALGTGVDTTGAGTLLSAEREPTKSDIDLEVPPDVTCQQIIDALNALGAPKGSTIRYGADETEHPFGVTEGVGIYLNGTDLPEDTYANNDINDLISKLGASIGGAGRMLSYWEGPSETALYYYGPEAAAIRSAAEPVLATHPLAERSRLVDLT